MPTSFLELKKAKIDDADTDFAYIDSGPPPGDTYITLVIVHGFMYTSREYMLYNLSHIPFNSSSRSLASPFYFNSKEYVH